MLPRDVTAAVVAEELPPLQAYAERHGWSVEWKPEPLVLLLGGAHPDGSPVRVMGDLIGYRAQPPAWCVMGLDPDHPERKRFPQGGALPGGIGSIFHSSKVICAPFNRLAFKHLGGPHEDWGGLTDWLRIAGKVRAERLADMLAVIDCHLRYCSGWKT